MYVMLDRDMKSYMAQWAFLSPQERAYTREAADRLARIAYVELVECDSPMMRSKWASLLDNAARYEACQHSVHWAGLCAAFREMFS